MEPMREIKVQLAAAFAASGMSKAELARQMRTDFKSIQRLLDPDTTNEIETLVRALDLLGYDIQVAVVKRHEARPHRNPAAAGKARTK